MLGQVPLRFVPLDLDTFASSERFMVGMRLGATFSQGMHTYLQGTYHEAAEQLKAALISAYVEGEEATQIFARERAIIHLYLGNCVAVNEQWEEALREYLEAVQIDPQLAEAHYNLGISFAAVDQLERAISALKEALEYNPGLYEAHFALGCCYQQADDAGRAYIHYTSACTARPDAAEPRYALGLMHQSHGAHELAQRCFAEALHMDLPPLSADPANPLLSRSEDEVVAWYYQFSAKLKQQHYEEEAERIYRLLLEWRPHEYQAHVLLGNLRARQQELDEALVHYAAVPPGDRAYVDARLRMATVLHLRGEDRRAYALLVACARRNPDQGHLWLQMGKLLQGLGRYPSSLRALKRAVQLLPREPQAHYRLGLAYAALGYSGRATAAWRHAVLLAPDDEALHFDLATLLVQRGRYMAASHELQQVLARNPADHDARFLLGLCYKELLDPARAIPLFEQVLEHDPQHIQALYYVGACHLQIGSTSLGQHYLRRYEELTFSSTAGAEGTMPASDIQALAG